jgi:hypothetical protein
MPDTLLEKAHAVTWSTWRRKTASVSVVLTFVALLSGTIVKVAQAWPFFEPKLPVTYGTFLEIINQHDKELRVLIGEHEKEDKNVAAKIEKNAIDFKLDLARGKRDVARDKGYDWQDKMEAATDPEKKQMYKDRMRESIDTKSELDAQIKTLNRLRGTDQ